MAGREVGEPNRNIDREDDSARESSDNFFNRGRDECGQLTTPVNDDDPAAAARGVALPWVRRDLSDPEAAGAG